MDKRELKAFGSYVDNTCEGLTRRDLLKVGTISFLGLGLTEFLALKAAADAPKEPKSKGAKQDISVILLWMAGGPSHVDTFDPKPDAPMTIRGPFEAIETKAPGMMLSEHLPKLAGVADKFSVIRSLTHGDGAHERAQHYLQTGYLPIPTMEFPSYGAVLAKERGMANNLPPYVTLVGRDGEGYGPGFLGGSHSPFFAGNPNDGNYKVPDLPLPNGVNRARLDRRRALLSTLDTLSRNNDAVKSMDTFFNNAYNLVTSTDSQKAFEIGQEANPLRDLYGRNPFGQACLLARRLVSSGVRFVTITQGGWDTHENNFPSLKNGLLPTVDQGMSALLTDLSQRGMLDSTLVLWMGEFGRTPEINKNANPGRDHWPNAMSVAIAGGGVRGGQVIGETDERGMGPKERAIHVEDLAATLYHALGIDPEKEYITPSGRPVRLANDGKVIRELF
jgi:hypothetical protein